MITIFTPTYNRCHLLPQLYKSLRTQTCFDFEWLVIDDGSNDDTKVFFESLFEEKFSIRYYYQENAGKHIAINRAIDLAKGEWMLIVDSDDFLLENAISILKARIATIEDDMRFCSVVSNRVTRDGKISGSICTYDILDTDYFSYRAKFKFKGERPSCIRISVWKEFKFPEYQGEKFCTEALVLNRIAKKYLCRYVNEQFYVMEYQSDGLTYNVKKRLTASPHYATLFYYELSKFSGIRNKIVSYYSYWKYYCLCPKRYADVSPNLTLFILGIPVYFICLLLKKMKYKE